MNVVNNFTRFTYFLLQVVVLSRPQNIYVHCSAPAIFTTHAVQKTSTARVFNKFVILAAMYPYKAEYSYSLNTYSG
jgi:hypothetical protein